MWVINDDLLVMSYGTFTRYFKTYVSLGKLMKPKYYHSNELELCELRCFHRDISLNKGTREISLKGKV